MSYTWDIVKLHTEAVSGQAFVVRVDWRLTATDGDLTIVRDGIEYFSQPDDLPADFIAFDALTKETVMGWVLGRVNKATEERAIMTRIENEKQRTTAEAPLPWATEA